MEKIVWFSVIGNGGWLEIIGIQAPFDCMFAASGSLQVDGETVLDLQNLLGLLDQAKGRFIPLEDGSFLALTKALQKRLEEFRTYSYKGQELALRIALAKR